MGDVKRHEIGWTSLDAGVGPGTIALIVAGIIAFLFAGAAMFENFSEHQAAVETSIPAGRPASDPASRDLLNNILGQQISTRQDLADLRRTLAAQPKQPAQSTPAVQPTQPAQSVPVPRRCPDCARPPDLGPVLAQIDTYLASIASDTNMLVRFSTRGGPRPEGGDIGSVWQRLIRTISEARAYVRTQRDAFASAEPAEQPGLFLAATPAPAPAPAGEPSATSLASVKIYIIVGMFLVLGIVFIIAAVAIFAASNPAAIAFATDIVKTMLGFFIGVLSAFMGAPG